MAKKPKIAAAKAHTAEPVKNLAAKPKTASKAKAPRAKAAASKRMHNSHSDVAERMLQLAQFLSQDPEEAKVFAKKTGVYTNSGELTAAYR
ncbi:hypothetical protein [Pseudomonas sp. OA65]|uniref:hypothetical protein n=1 Tax=Pseudomonas sp. OA65 TaxID=2818431 RepID=UPI001A9CDBF2|nr:hypothetical protein [Pseudomonas sp. OA65]MBO1536735.1 hypothetical protein [Pseudomonas sp. OA65]